ncbi:DUF4166 domain-containing protein [Microbacterium sp. LWH12-1.2]|uniref:DUF4166 domain-containing protein n=1 Tax=Microbacterium sp. LWH12-1.2 TaxID=3135259 RepID=UPI00342B2535
MIPQGGVFLRALGVRSQQLHPAILAQLSQPHAPEDSVHGVFETAGSRFGRLAFLARPVLGPSLLLTRFGTDVPFVLTARASSTAAGRAVLETTRRFEFPGATEVISDRLVEDPEAGGLRNLLGDRRRIELILDCAVTDQGSLRMQSRHVALVLGGLRIPLRGPFGIVVSVEDGWDAEHQRRTIAMEARHPLLGTVLEYRGWYRPNDLGDADSQYE